MGKYQSTGMFKAVLLLYCNPEIVQRPNKREQIKRIRGHFPGKCNWADMKKERGSSLHCTVYNTSVSKMSKWKTNRLPLA